MKTQLSMMSVIRPPDGFESVYQGLASSVPIAFPGTLDPLAGEPGYSPDLLAGIRVSLGARVFVQIPMIVDEYLSVPGYTYKFMWRTRNQSGFNQAQLNGKPASEFHLRGDELGRRNFEPGGQSQDLFFLPGASDIELFEQAEPVGDGAASLTMRQQIYLPVMGASWSAPRTPAGNNGIWQQGVYQYTSNVNCSGPTFFPLWLDACGDEMLILVSKPADGGPWDFGGSDRGFSNTYGNNNGALPNTPNVGILISTGSMGGG